VAEFLREKSEFHYGKCPFYFFEPPLGGLEATHAVHIRLIGKSIVNFLLVIIKPFYRAAWNADAVLR